MGEEAKGMRRKFARKSIWEIDQDDMEERIAARRDRIRKRIDAAKKMTKLMKIQKMMGFKGDEDEQMFVEKATSQGNKNIHNILHNGRELATNIMLAAENIYCEQRLKNETREEEMNNILEEEDKQMKEKFREIMHTWPTNAEKFKGAPIELFDEILKQKDQCNELLQSKNRIIEMLEAENRSADEDYKELVQHYHTNISEMAGRMESHAHAFQQMLKQERQNLDKSLNHQKADMLQRGGRNWQALLEKTKRTSEECMQERLDLVVEQEHEMKEIIQTDYEQLADTRTRMESVVSELESQIHMVAALTHLNSERLDYEIHVLNKHEEENTIIKAEQKRKITILQDSVNKLKSKVKDAAKNKEKEKQILIESIKNIKIQLKELEEKQKKYGEQSEKKRFEMNKIMKKQAYELLEQLQRNDQILRDLYMNVPLADAAIQRKKSDYMFSRLSSKSEEDFSSKRSSKIMSFVSRSRSSSMRRKASEKMTTQDSAQNLKQRLLSLIEKADFLVEDDLNALMEVLPDKDKLLLKVDSILGALGVREEKDIEKIFHHLAVSDEGTSIKTEDPNDALSMAEKRSKILKIVRGYMEEPEATMRSQQKSMALFSGFNVVKKMADTIQPDREGYMWSELKDAIEEFKSADRVNLKNLLVRYKDILVARSDYMTKNENLKRENEELRNLLKNFIPQKPME